VARLPLGTAILRRYVLIGAIGQGGVSTVYSAVDARRGRKLAVKVLAPMLADDPDACDDVRREALITDRLRHPSVDRAFAVPAGGRGHDSHVEPSRAPGTHTGARRARSAG
jgi:serine/threonine-protein kinase